MPRNAAEVLVDPPLYIAPVFGAEAAAEAGALIAGEAAESEMIDNGPVDGVEEEVSVMALLNPLRLALLGQLFVVFIIALIQSASRVAIAALSPLESLKPAVVAVPLDLRTDLGIATLANLVLADPRHHLPACLR